MGVSHYQKCRKAHGLYVMQLKINSNYFCLHTKKIFVSRKLLIYNLLYLLNISLISCLIFSDVLEQNWHTFFRDLYCLLSVARAKFILAPLLSPFFRIIPKSFMTSIWS